MDYLAEIARISLLFRPVEPPKAKRYFDIAATSLLFVVSLPLTAAIMLSFGAEYIFRRDSRGPLLYSETRISKGQPFKLYKFRIFKKRAISGHLKQHGFVQTKELEQDKNNLTFTGRVLKQIYMDELPQLLNVFKGEMALVGPRPSNEVVTYNDALQGHFQRYLLVCGLTGPFQIQKDKRSFSDQNAVDMEYVMFCKTAPGWKIVGKDIKILVQTIFTVLRARGV